MLVQNANCTLFFFFVRAKKYHNFMWLKICTGLQLNAPVLIFFVVKMHSIQHIACDMNPSAVVNGSSIQSISLVCAHCCSCCCCCRQETCSNCTPALTMSTAEQSPLISAAILYAFVFYLLLLLPVLLCLLLLLLLLQLLSFLKQF